jgi:amino acid transporter
MNNRELLWKQYELNVDLYKSYLDLAIKMNIFYYAITGAILSFYFAHPDENLVKWSLALPLIMSIVLGVFFVICAWLARVPRNETFKIREALGLMAAPEIGVLIFLLIIFTIPLFSVAAGLSWLLFMK